MSNYLGVPIGATIAWVGSLYGVPLPANFIVNYDFGGSFDTRISEDFTNTSYSATASNVVLQSHEYSDISELGVGYTTVNSVTLTAYNTPPLTDTTPESTEDIEISLTDFNTMFSIYVDTYWTKESSDCSTRYIPLCKDWEVDEFDGDISGSGYYELKRNSSSDSVGGAVYDDTHTHSTGTSYKSYHNHNISGKPSLSYSSSGTSYNDSGSQDDITYSLGVQSSLGVVYITRVW
jgi:hypothetical protein